MAGGISSESAINELFETALGGLENLFQGDDRSIAVARVMLDGIAQIVSQPPKG